MRVTSATLTSAISPMQRGQGWIAQRMCSPVFSGEDMTAIIDLPIGEYTNISTTATMTADTPYRFQNVGDGIISIIFSTTLPPAGDKGFIYNPDGPDAQETLVYDGTEEIWGRSLDVFSKIALQEVVL